jgi:hypothetical protein
MCRQYPTIYKKNAKNNQSFKEYWIEKYIQYIKDGDIATLIVLKYIAEYENPQQNDN